MNKMETINALIIAIPLWLIAYDIGKIKNK
jgi:hypothetical protein